MLRLLSDKVNLERFVELMQSQWFDCSFRDFTKNLITSFKFIVDIKFRLSCQGVESMKVENVN